MAKRRSVAIIRQLEQEAWGMAQSGRYADYRAIRAEFDLTPPRKRFFANAWVQQELDRICRVRFRLPA
jgi:hypothetical protein